MTILLACGTAQAQVKGPPLAVASITVSVYLDDSAPTADTITPTTTSPTNGTTVSFLVSFNEDVQNFDTDADLVVTETGSVTHTGVSITGGGQDYSVDVTGVSGNGTMALTVNTSSDVQDDAGNALSSSVTSSAVIIDSAGVFNTIYLDFILGDDENTGTEQNNPVKTFAVAYANVTTSGTIRIQTGDTSETPRITKAMRIETIGGIVRIGVPDAGSKSPSRAVQTAESGTAQGDEAGTFTDPLRAFLLALANALRDSLESDSDGDDESAQRGDGTVHEPVIPFSMTGDASHAAKADSALAIRLRSEADIDPDSIWGPLPGYSEDQATVEWRSVGEGNLRDVWVIFRPKEMWYLEDVITLTAGARTTDGESLQSETYQFQVESEEEYQTRRTTPEETIWQPEYNEDFDATGLDLEAESNDTAVLAPANGTTDSEPLAEGIEAPLSIGPERVYTVPQRIWLPVPEGIDPNTVQLYYYHPNGDDQGWYPAQNVQGWLVPDSYLHLRTNGTTYLGFLVRHAAIVQLGVPTPMTE